MYVYNAKYIIYFLELRYYKIIDYCIVLYLTA